ncbi:MAG: beta-mannosidase [Bacteroidaceae bacterium]|nr:beta-mannosidase [Bacteroidaceae bacterium]
MRLGFTIICLAFCVGTWAQSTTKQLKKALKQSTEKGVMFGHHDDTIYGYEWGIDEVDRSDTKDVVGMYPAMMSFDLRQIEKRKYNKKMYDKMREEIIRQHARGGFVTISWHADNVVTGGSAWDTINKESVRSVLPGGPKADEFLALLDTVANYLKSLTAADGTQIPFIFRPWHECNGSWFWWGSDFCTPDEYRALWKLTVKRLKKDGVKNIIYAYSPGAYIKSEQEYMARYPGDKIISVLGVEGYAIKTTGSDADRQRFIKASRKSFDIASAIAIRKNKLLAWTETGTKFNTDTQWWTKALMPAMEGYPVCYLVTWRNGTNRDDDCFSVYKGHISESDFKLFARNPRIIFKE